MTCSSILLSLVNENPGINSTDLIVQTVKEAYKNGVDPEPLVKDLNWLVKDGKIAEVEYVLKNSSYRLRSLYFPVGTVGRLINFQEN